MVLRATGLAVRLEAIRAGVGTGLLPCYAGDRDPLLERVTDPVPELAADYWVIVHRDLRRAACVRAVIDWIRRLFDQHHAVLAGLGESQLSEPADAVEAGRRAAAD